MTTKPNNQKYSRGFALLLSIIIASVVLSIGISILKISVSQLQLSASGRESEVSFQTAQAITECLKYWYYSSPSFRARPGIIQPSGGDLAAPPFECMKNAPAVSYARVLLNDVDGPDGPHLVKYYYQYEWGDAVPPQFCSTADLYVFVNPTDNQIFDPFTNNGVLQQFDDVTATSSPNSASAVLVAQGYNRRCDELETSIFTIQRELTSQF